MKKFKFHIVATEGSTIDGRKISGQHLEQMARNYDPNKYGARVWLEHIRGLMPDSAFNALGDVVELKTEKNADGKTILLAAIEPTPELVKINQSGQKIYSSVEIQTNFADSGEAYLVGLAVTDSPASLGTSRLTFSATQKNPDNLYSEYQEVNLNDVEPEGPSILERVKNLFSRSEAADRDLASRLDTAEQAIETVASQFADSEKTLAADLAALKKEFADLKQQLDATPAPSNIPAQNFATPRPQATGATATQTDC